MTSQLDIFSQPKNSFHNSIPIHGEELVKAEKRANRSERDVLKFFERHPKESFTAYQVYEKITEETGVVYRETSIRRAITNLTDDDKLVKSGMVPGNFSSHQINTWKLKCKNTLESI